MNTPKAVAVTNQEYIYEIQKTIEEVITSFITYCLKSFHKNLEYCTQDLCLVMI